MQLRVGTLNDFQSTNEFNDPLRLRGGESYRID